MKGEKNARKRGMEEGEGRQELGAKGAMEKCKSYSPAVRLLHTI